MPLFIITSSSVKYDHISYLCGLRNVELTRLPYTYQEIQENNMKTLLRYSLENVFFQEKKDVFFIIEQTSVYFNAFPEKGPGFYFKDWWNNKSEEEFKNIARKDTRAYIESGVALNIPGHSPLIFINRQSGNITFDGYIHPDNHQYSWLSQNDFNQYFIPSKAKNVYNAMSLNETLKYDFRKPNLDKLCTRLEEYYAILNNGMEMKKIINIAENFRSNKYINDKLQKRIDAKDWIG